MLPSWRWFGPEDPVSLDDIRQAGATGVVTSLHDLRSGDIWPVEDIRDRKQLIESASPHPLVWSVVESVPVHEAIKKGLPERDQYIETYCQTLRNLAECGISTVCYNFMPILDWTRTDLSFDMPDGSQCLQYDNAVVAAFDMFILRRKGAYVDFDSDTIARAESLYSRMDDSERQRVTGTILAGLPGSVGGYTIDQFRSALDSYEGIDESLLRHNLAYFLKTVIPVAEEVGIQMAIHPDDPPYSIFGLPRIVSTEEDLRRCFAATPSDANGFTMCTGSLGVHPSNDLVGMIHRLGGRMHFVHLRNIRRDVHGTFLESGHLDGDVDMVAVIGALLDEETRRSITGPQVPRIPVRPDHGHRIMSDLERDCKPGYSALGRLRGLAELRGLEHGLRAMRI